MRLLKKGDFSSFIGSLISKYDVVAPVKQDIVRFKVLDKGDAAMGFSNVVFERPLYPAKDFFLPRGERFYSFKGQKISGQMAGQAADGRPRRPAKTAFFMNRCDVNAVHRNDLIMLEEPADPYYKEKRRNAILVEIPCIVSENCSCLNIGNIDCYDLKIIDPGEKSENFVLDAATDKGRELIKDLFLPAADFRKEQVHNPEPRGIKEGNKDVWEKYGMECFSCSACTVVCPTCTCFTINGDLSLKGDEGKLYRDWASCQLLEYTKVAGGFVFRRDRGARGRQRLHCKFQYFRQKFGHNRCVGCGRCNDACPTGINIFHYFSELK